MKKFLALLMAAMMVLSLAACGNSEPIQMCEDGLNKTAEKCQLALPAPAPTHWHPIHPPLEPGVLSGV